MFTLVHAVTGKHEGGVLARRESVEVARRAGVDWPRGRRRGSGFSNVATLHMACSLEGEPGVGVPGDPSDLFLNILNVE